MAAAQMLRQVSLTSNKLLTNQLSCITLPQRYIKKITRYESSIYQKSKPINDYLPEHLQRKTRVYAWGQCMTGALGMSNYLEPQDGSPIIKQALSPVKIDPLSEYNNVIDIAACHGFSLFVVRGKHHALVGCGLNVYNQLGWQEFEKSRLALLIKPVPIHLPIDNKSPPVKVSGGRCHSLVLLEDGSVYGLGSNECGQLGIPDIGKAVYDKPQALHKISLPEEVTQVVCGMDHSLFLTRSGCVYSCGLGADGQTGLGHYKNTWSPQLVEGDIKGEKIVQLSGCADSVLALSESGEVFGWGNSEYMQFTTVCEERQLSTPKHIPVTKVTGKVSCVAAGGTNCAVVSEKNEVYTWGFGFLGQGPKTDYKKEPTIIPRTVFGCDEFNPDCKVESVVAGLRHFAALTNHGDLFMWGANRHGSLGMGGFRDNSVPDVFYPMRVSLTGNVTKVSLGTDHTIAILKV